MDLADTLGEIAQAAGALLLARQSRPRDIDTKSSDIDLVTDADPLAEALIQARLCERFPGASLLMEESGAEKAPGEGHADLTFVVDPLDGTTNYAHRVPHFAVNLAAERGGERVAAATFDPSRDELFLAEKGAGAWLNGRRIHVSDTPSLDASLLVTGFAYRQPGDPDDNHTEFAALNLMTRGVRRHGAAALDMAWVACGRFDGYWERNIQPWDIAPGILLLEEAGGRCSRYDAEPVGLRDREIVATNGAIHDALRSVVGRARKLAGVA
jgi:myo-inositol-1(or 4)-monophosphatase